MRTRFVISPRSRSSRPWPCHELPRQRGMASQLSGFLTGMKTTGGGGNVLHAIHTESSGLVYGTTAAKGCPAGEVAIGGGGGCDNGGLRASQPVNGGWEIVCAQPGWNRAYVICARQ